MASALRHISLGIPFRGLDTDSSPSRLSDAHATTLHNVVVTPTEIRSRRGWQEGTGWYTVAGGTPGNWWPAGAVVFQDPFNQAAYIAIVEEDDTDFGGEYLGLNTGGTLSGTLRSIVIPVPVAEGLTVGTASAASIDIIPTGPGAQYDGVLYFVGDDAAGLAQVYMWAGSNATNHTTGGVTINNGATSGTFSSAPAASKQGAFLTVTGGATGPSAGYRYSYKITSHTGGSGNFSIDQPYGLGESTANVPNAVGASTTIAVNSVKAHTFGAVTNSPLDVGAVTVWRDRLWVGRQTNNGSAPKRTNKLAWSQALYPQKFPSANSVLVGEDEDAIMGLSVANDALYIFKQRSTWVITGYDEDSFTLRPLYGDLGLLDSDTLCSYRDQIVWLSNKGVFMTQGFGDPVELSQDRNGAGVRDEILDAAEPNTQYARIIKASAAVQGDDLLLAIQDRDINDVTPRPAWRYNFKYGQWTTFGNTSNSGRRQPWFFVPVGPRVHAITPYQMVDINRCFTGEDAGRADAEKTDTDFNTSDLATVSTVIDADVQFRDVRLGGNDTVRVRGVQIEHNCHYYGASSSPRVAWAVTLDRDSEIDTSSTAVGNVDARWVGNTGAVKFDKYYVDRFSDTTFPTEGAVFRVKMSKTATTHSAKLFDVSLLIDGQAVMLGRVDNATV